MRALPSPDARRRFPTRDVAFKKGLIGQNLRVSNLMLNPKTLWGKVLLAYEIQTCTASGEVGG